jgi:hypothetical protein
MSEGICKENNNKHKGIICTIKKCYIIPIKKSPRITGGILNKTNRRNLFIMIFRYIFELYD